MLKPVHCDPVFLFYPNEFVFDLIWFYPVLSGFIRFYPVLSLQICFFRFFLLNICL